MSDDRDDLAQEFTYARGYETGMAGYWPLAGVGIPNEYFDGWRAGYQESGKPWPPSNGAGA